MKKWFVRVLKENKSFLLFIILMCVFRSAVADWNTVPTGSMKPTILEGDRILVNKMAYDIRLPFTHISLYKTSEPARGDIIVFDSEVAELKLVKRVIGVPGDTVELENNALRVNGVQLSYEDVELTDLFIDQSEDLLGLKHLVRVAKVETLMSSFPSVEVPSGYYLALGDNRDNSSDSRVIGFVPRNEIVGKTNSVIMSFNYDNYYIPRLDRFFHTL